MPDTRRQIGVLSRRAAILGAGQGLLLAVVAGRMYQLQILEADKYRTLAKENQIALQLLSPPRGLILDRYGRPVARNAKLYRINMVAHRGVDVPATLERLGGLIELDGEDLDRIVRQVRLHRGFGPVTVHESLRWQDVARLSVNAPDLPGVEVEVDERRHYPYGDRMSHLVGYVAAASESDIGDGAPSKLPQMQIGKSGVEQSQEGILRGKPGSREVEVNARGRVIRRLSIRRPQQGRDVQLALDIDLQVALSERLKKERGAAAVLLDVHTGEVLAQASVPAYDPNVFVTGLSSAVWRDLQRDPLTPMIDRTVSGLFAPGSTFKTVVALAALEGKVVDKSHRVFCRGFINLGSHRFHCWKRGGHGLLDLVGGYQQSCNVYFYDLARRLGPDSIAEMAGRLGLGVRTGIELAGEKAGTVPSRAWKRKNLGEPWYGGETLSYAIGQGFVLATPLQLAVMTARVANGRKAVTPRLLRAGPEAAAGHEDLGISEESMSILHDAMFHVCNVPRGTAYRSRIKTKGMEMSGKTGTSQVRRFSIAERQAGVRKNKDLEWGQRDHGLFIAYAPSDKPRYAMSVIVQHGGGSSVAVPIAREILEAAQRRTPPDGSKSPTASLHPRPAGG